MRVDIGSGFWPGSAALVWGCARAEHLWRRQSPRASWSIRRLDAEALDHSSSSASLISWSLLALKSVMLSQRVPSVHQSLLHVEFSSSTWTSPGARLGQILGYDGLSNSGEAGG
jgi:hypothetical protein